MKPIHEEVSYTVMWSGSDKTRKVAEFLDLQHAKEYYTEKHDEHKSPGLFAIRKTTTIEQVRMK